MSNNDGQRLDIPKKHTTGERGKTFMPNHDVDDNAPIVMHPMYIQIEMDDFQRLRDAARNAMAPMVVYTPDVPEEMRREAEEQRFKCLNDMQIILDKYEYMEHEGFAGPGAAEALEDEKRRNYHMVSQLVLDMVDQYCDAIATTITDDLDDIGIRNSSRPEFSADIARLFDINLIPEEDYSAWVNINDVIEYAWNNK